MKQQTSIAPQIPALVSFKDNVGYVVRRFSQAMRSQIGESLRALGVTTSQYAALCIVEQNGEQTNAQLARALFVTPQTMTRILGGMVDNGWLERRASEHHLRVRLFQLTPAGQALLNTIHPAFTAAQDRLFAPLSVAERATLLDQLWACADAAPEAEAFDDF